MINSYFRAVIDPSGQWFVIMLRFSFCLMVDKIRSLNKTGIIVVYLTLRYFLEINMEKKELLVQHSLTVTVRIQKILNNKRDMQCSLSRRATVIYKICRERA